MFTSTGVHIGRERQTDGTEVSHAFWSRAEFGVGPGVPRPQT